MREPPATCRSRLMAYVLTNPRGEHIPSLHAQDQPLTRPNPTDHATGLRPLLPVAVASASLSCSSCGSWRSEQSTAPAGRSYIPSRVRVSLVLLPARGRDRGWRHCVLLRGRCADKAAPAFGRRVLGSSAVAGVIACLGIVLIAFPGIVSGTGVADAPRCTWTLIRRVSWACPGAGLQCYARVARTTSQAVRGLFGAQCA